MMNNNCQEYDCSIESSLLRCNKPFHFCSKDTHITLLLREWSEIIRGGGLQILKFCKIGKL